MSSKTNYYGMVYFDLGDALDSDFSDSAEINRWTFVDSQLYGLMSVFGNGVVQGWNVSQVADFDIQISSGFGNINFISCRTSFDTPITSLAPNSVVYIYARSKTRTPVTEEVDFIISGSKTDNSPFLLLLAEIVVGQNSILTIDESVRQSIRFIDIIKALINKHHHRGGSTNPSKIDLSSEVKGQLPSFRIEPIDAKKITTGVFDFDRFPLLSHNELSNIGILTHAQLDTFVKTIETNNKELLGEIVGSDLMQFILALKFVFDDPNSALHLNTIFDKNMWNEISVIPGITPDKYIDFNHTTATVDLINHEIIGNGPTIGTSFWVTYDTDLAWNLATFKENITISNNQVTLSINQSDEANIVSIESFEEAKSPGENLSTGSPFRKETIMISDNAEIAANSSATNVVDGFYSGKFTYKESFRVQFVKEFTSGQNWSAYDSFILSIKCITIVHGSVKLYFVDSSGNKSIEYVLLDENEITTGTSTSNGFDFKVVHIPDISFNTDIKQIVIFTDDTTSDFNFYIDFINIQKAVLLPTDGTFRLRYSTRQSVIFRTIEWSSIELDGSFIQVQAKSANDTALLNRSDFITVLSSGDNVELKGTDLELQITLFPDPNRIVAPSLSSLRFMVISDSEIDGFTLSKAQDFARGSTANITVNQSPDFLSLESPINVGSYYYGLASAIKQTVQKTDSNGSSYNQDELALFGINSPIAPNQIFASKESFPATPVRESKLFDPRSVRRLTDRSFLIADTYNDRVLEIDEDGNLLNGFGSINYTHDSKVFPIATSFDNRTGILYIVWSKSISFTSVNVSLITVQSSTKRARLFSGSDKIMGLSNADLKSINPQGQIMPIYLASQNVGQVNSMKNEDTFVFFDSLVLSQGFDQDSVFYSAIFNGQGIPCFVGPFAYINGIFTPTHVEKKENGTYVVCNAKLAVKNFKFDSATFGTGTPETVTQNIAVSSIVEVDRNNNVIFGKDIVNFSPFIPGKIQSIGSDLYLIGGLQKDGTIDQFPNTFIFRTLNGTQEQRKSQRDILSSMFTKLTGTVIVYDKKAQASIFQYVSPEGLFVSDVEINSFGQYVVAESSFSGKSGRIITLDSFGNIIFSYGEGLYSCINSIRVLHDDTIVIST